jgi:hypothetical protein
VGDEVPGRCRGRLTGPAWGLIWTVTVRNATAHRFRGGCRSCPSLCVQTAACRRIDHVSWSMVNVPMGIAACRSVDHVTVVYVRAAASRPIDNMTMVQWAVVMGFRVRRDTATGSPKGVRTGECGDHSSRFLHSGRCDVPGGGRGSGAGMEIGHSARRASRAIPEGSTDTPAS